MLRTIRKTAAVSSGPASDGPVRHGLNSATIEYESGDHDRRCGVP